MGIAALAIILVIVWYGIVLPLRCLYKAWVFRGWDRITALERAERLENNPTISLSLGEQKEQLKSLKAEHALLKWYVHEENKHERRREAKQRVKMERLQAIARETARRAQLKDVKA